MTAPLRVAVLASGVGTTLERLAATWSSPASPVVIALVVCDRPSAAVVGRARTLGLPLALIERRDLNSDAFGRELTRALKEAKVELVVLAGFLSILAPSWVEAWQGRAVNLHPSLLPRYSGRGMYGRRVHEAVLAAGEAETGATVHVVTSDVDAGPTLGQVRLPIRPDDTSETLRARLAPLEVDLLRRTVERFARGELPLPYR